MAFQRAMPILEVRNVDRAVRFWARAGFATHGTWEDNGTPSFAIVQRGAITLGLTRRDAPATNAWWAAYLYVDNLADLHAEYAAAGLCPTQIHRAKDYGCDDFDLICPDGHRIAFGQDRAPEPGPGLSGDNGKG